MNNTTCAACGKHCTVQGMKFCPFCGAGLVRDDGKVKFFDNAKDALFFIAQKHGNDVLLGKQLRAFFPDYAPSVSANMKGLVFAVYEKGAAQILHSHQNATAAEKEIAVKRAVAKLTEAFIAREAAENIIGEFVEALGWQVSAPVTVQPPVSTQRKQPAPTRTLQQPQQQPKSTYQASAGAAAEILRGDKQHVRFGGYIWRVLDVQDNRALLLTEDIIDKRPYDTQYSDVTWETCALRQYLNGEFYSKFCKQDRARILETHNPSANNRWFGTKCRNGTMDKVFLLSLEEVLRCFGSSGRVTTDSCFGTHTLLDDQYNSIRESRMSGEKWWWWLRSPGKSNSSAVTVRVDGIINITGIHSSEMRTRPDYSSGGVRPALWLNLKA